MLSREEKNLNDFIFITVFLTPEKAKNLEVFRKNIRTSGALLKKYVFTYILCTLKDIAKMGCKKRPEFKKIK